ARVKEVEKPTKRLVRNIEVGLINLERQQDFTKKPEPIKLASEDRPQCVMEERVGSVIGLQPLPEQFAVTWKSLEEVEHHQPVQDDRGGCGSLPLRQTPQRTLQGTMFVGVLLAKAPQKGFASMLSGLCVHVGFRQTDSPASPYRSGSAR